MESLCGGWEAVLPRGQLVIARTGGHHTLTFYSPNGIRRGPERLRGGRCPHYGRGKGRTELWLSEDGRTLLLVPGNTYRRIGPPQKKKSNLKHSTTMRTKNVGNEEIGGIVARRKREHAENGRLLAALDWAGLTENTIVFFASYHGETMTSHSTEDPKNSIWRESLNIPFLVRYPGRVPHRVDDLLLSPPDIMPTLLGLAGLGERVPASVEGRDYSAVLRQDAVQPERPRAALYMRNLDGGRDADGLVRGFFAQARGVKTVTHTMELRIGRDGTLERVLMFDDAADPYQLHNLAPEEHPALFAALCRELAVLLRDNDDVWFREGVLSDVVPYDTNN